MEIKANKRGKVVGLIPARGGSKGVARKNIREVCGLPLIAYTIKAAQKSGVVDRIVVSTDDEEIAAVARKYGADVPFIRPAVLASDTAGDKGVIEHFVDWLLKNESEEYFLLAYLRPTTPLKTPGIIDDAVSMLRDNRNLTSVRSVTNSEAIYHPFWMYKEAGDQTLEPFIDGVSVEKYYQRQLLPACFRLNGVCDVMRLPLLRGQSGLYGDKIGKLLIPDDMSIDIDTELDLAFFKFLIAQKVENNE